MVAPIEQAPIYRLESCLQHTCLNCRIKGTCCAQHYRWHADDVLLRRLEFQRYRWSWLRMDLE